MGAVGAYQAKRASALSGVPESTVHWWAREGILVPSVSALKVKMWSYSDLMSLRVIYWLRKRKTDECGVDIPATSMPAVKEALAELKKLELPLWQEHGSSVLVNGEGRVYLVHPEGLQTARGQIASDELLDLIAPFTTREGLLGPDLRRPRATLRIDPSKLSGSPHVADTRIETRALSALRRDGFDAAKILAWYPDISPQQLDDAFALESQLSENLNAAA